MATAVIKPIPEEVINLIAAGEVIHRPANVVKELLENSLDAGSTKILISILKKGTTIKIKDNGCGINKDDLPIVCVRFTSSKLSKIEDLTDLKTYGFRGEALCSMAQVAKVTILTKPKSSPLGYEATYDKSNLEKIKKVAANDGTVVTISDLFFNMPERRSDVENKSRAEYAKIVDIVRKYAIRCHECEFMLDSDQNRFSDVETQGNDKTQLDRIRQFYGAKVANNLISIKYDGEEFDFKLEGFVNNTNSVLNKYTFILFINGRLVDCELLKKKLQDIYTEKLMKGYGPFIYLNLEIFPQHIDVNLHPSKREVRYLNEDVINDKIRDLIEQNLLHDSGSRDMKISTSLCQSQLLRQSSFSKSEADESGLLVHEIEKTDFNVSEKLNACKGTSSSCEGTPHESKTRKVLQPWNKVRNDCKTKKIFEAFKSMEVVEKVKLPDGREAITLNSVKTLIAAKNKYRDARLTHVIRNSTFVGLIDPHLIMIQYRTELICFKYKIICHQLFYQLYLENFGVFNVLRLKNPLSLDKLLQLHQQQTPSEHNFSAEEMLQQRRSILKTVLERAEMLKDYFSLEIDEQGNLNTLPILIDGHVPNLTMLPSFVHSLQRVIWDTEKLCFYTFGQLLADFYSLPSLDLEEMRRTAEFYVYPKIKEFLRPSDVLYDCYLSLANLNDLYKVFERC